MPSGIQCTFWLAPTAPANSRREAPRYLPSVYRAFLRNAAALERASAARGVVEHSISHVTSSGRSPASRSNVAPQPISMSSQCAPIHSTRSAFYPPARREAQSFSRRHSAAVIESASSRPPTGNRPVLPCDRMRSCPWRVSIDCQKPLYRKEARRRCSISRANGCSTSSSPSFM